MILFIVVCVIFFLLIRFCVPRDGPKESLKKNTKLTFEIPTEIIVAHQPGMTVYEREKRRRRLLNEVFKLGFFSREAFEVKNEQDRKLTNTPLILK